MQCTAARNLCRQKTSCDGIQDVSATLSIFIKWTQSLQLFIPSTGGKLRTWHLCYKAIHITLISWWGMLFLMQQNSAASHQLLSRSDRIFFSCSNKFFGIVFTKKKKNTKMVSYSAKLKKKSFCSELLYISLMLMGILLSKSKNRYVQQTG